MPKHFNYDAKSRNASTLYDAQQTSSRSADDRVDMRQAPAARRLTQIARNEFNKEAEGLLCPWNRRLASEH
ncbi:hypothetical protein ALC53_10983 [Atta colombica]|uniref:Uncharacterized protein n=1 Tax=Atta colombica TaxID=520822 RepID=A0A195B1G0_9HYME|nr:hypothetical protein ALC53_10983 [Atta colombica]